MSFSVAHPWEGKPTIVLPSAIFFEICRSRWRGDRSTGWFRPAREQCAILWFTLTDLALLETGKRPNISLLFAIV